MENKTEKQAKRWLIETMGLREDDITKSRGTPDFLTPIGGFEVKKLYGDKIIFYSNQLEILARYPDVTILIFDGDGHFVRKASYLDIDLEHSVLGDIRVINSQMTSIQITRSVAMQLQSLGKMHDTYDDILRRLLNGSKGEPDENWRVDRDESTRVGHHQEG